MKRKIFTLMFVALFGSTLVNAQWEKPTAVIKKATSAIVIDGDGSDAAWEDAEPNSINRPYGTELPTVGEEGETYWKGLWTDEGVYILVYIADDFFFPNYLSTGDDYLKDKVEIYFDVNAELVDGKGAGSDGMGNGSGHYQFAPNLVLEEMGGTEVTGTAGALTGVIYATLLEDPAYSQEYFVPFTRLLDKAGIEVLKGGQIGFDVTVIDNDTEVAARHRAVWSNDALSGASNANESWSNCDDIGIITLEGAEATVVATAISISAPSYEISTEGGTVQFEAAILPENATLKVPQWIVVNKAKDSKGEATITADGLLTGVINGWVTVTAKTADGSDLSASMDVYVANQVMTIYDVSRIKNGTFANEGDIYGGTNAPWGGWSADGGTAEVIDGVLTINAVIGANGEMDNWRSQVTQSNLDIINDEPYVLAFTVWADEDRLWSIDFEDNEGNGYNRYGDSDSEFAVNQASQWDIPLTAEATRYEFNVTMKRLKENSDRKVVIMSGVSDVTVYLDSIYLVSVADLERVTKAQTSVDLVAYKYGTMEMATSFAEGEKLQVTSTVKNLPAYPVYSVVNGTGSATIDAIGVLTAVSPGTITVVGKDPVDPTVMDELAIEVLVGINDKVATQFSIAPNPVNDVLNITTATENPNVVIFNALGSKVYEGIQKQINVSNFAKGVYYIKVNESAAQKFVK